MILSGSLTSFVLANCCLNFFFKPKNSKLHDTVKKEQLDTIELLEVKYRNNHPYAY